MPSSRVTVTLPDELLQEIDRQDRNRSRFIQEAVVQELDRRRKELLLASLENPHPESTEMEQRGLEEWLANADSDDTNLVDMELFQPVRWTSEDGWKEQCRRGARNRRSGRT
ncbi:MAG: hypothetical protein AMXMBFR33_51280 [Candidatus Xenobia bacterium]